MSVAVVRAVAAVATVAAVAAVAAVAVVGALALAGDAAARVFAGPTAASGTASLRGLAREGALVGLSDDASLRRGDRRSVVAASEAAPLAGGDWAVLAALQLRSFPVAEG